MTRYRITFEDGETVICQVSSINQAIAGAVRRDKYDREIVKVEAEALSPAEVTEEHADLARVLDINRRSHQ